MYYGEVYEVPEKNDYDDYIGEVSILYRSGELEKGRTMDGVYEN